MKPEITKVTDANTGEIVSNCPIPEGYSKEIDETIAIHQQGLNAFMVMSQQLAEMNLRWLDKRKELNKTDTKIKDKMQFFCRKLKLSPNQPWTYNMGAKSFELREPPEVQPMSAPPIGVK